MATYKLKTISQVENLAPTKEDLVFCTELENYFQLKIPSSLPVDNNEVIDAKKFPTGQYIRVSDSGAGGGGESNTSSNSGGGIDLALPKAGVDLPFKTLVDGTNTTVIDNGLTIQIDAVGGGSSEIETFIYEPGGVASGNIYTDFYLLSDAINASTTSEKLVLVNIPGFNPVQTVTGDKSMGSWLNVTVRHLSGSSFNPTIELDGEVTFSTFPTVIEGISFRFRNTVSPVQRLLSGSLISVSMVNASITSGTVNGTNPTKPVFLLDEVGDGVLINMSGSKIGGENYPVIGGDVGGTVIAMTNNSSIFSNSLEGTWNGSVQPSLDSYVGDVQSLWTGVFNYDGRIDAINPTVADNYILTSIAGKFSMQPKGTVSAIAPTINDDSSTGQNQFSQWIDNVLNDAYICLDDSVGSAVWKKITP